MKIEVPIEELRKRKLFLATPMYGGMCAGMFARSVADLAAICTAHQIPLQFYFLFNESLITRARNYCCDEFMRNDATHLLFIDSDIGFNPNDVLAMLALQSDESPYDIIAAPYPKKNISWEKVKVAVDKGMADENPNNLERYIGDFVFNPKAGVSQIPINEPVEVLEAGTGFMMIRKNTMNKFAESFPHLNYTPDHVRTAQFDGSRKIMQFFQAEIDDPDYHKIFEEFKAEIGDATNVSIFETAFKKAVQATEAKRSNRYLSEDYWFCQKVQELGLKTWFCPWMQLQHVGTYVFGGSLMDLAQIGVAATADSGLLQKIKDQEAKKK